MRSLRPRSPLWQDRGFVDLWAANGISQLGSQVSVLAIPLTALFVLKKGALEVALVRAFSVLPFVAFSLPAGVWIDRVRRRPLIGIGYGMAAVGKLLIALATVWPVVLVARVVDRLGKGVRGAPRDALLVVGVPPEARGRAFGLHRTADTAGAVVGPLLGLAGYELLHHRIRPLLWIAVVPAVISVGLILFVRERPAVPRSDAAAAPSRADVEGLPTSYWRVVGVLTLFALVNFPDALLLLRLKEIGFSVVGVILAYVAYNTIYAALSFPAGAMSDRRSRRRVFGVGLVFFAIGYVGLGLTRSHVVAWLLLAAYGAYTAATDGVGKAWISSLVPSGRQGSAQGVFQGLSAAGILVAGLWAGLAWGDDGRLPLLVSGSVGAALAVWLLLAPRRLA
jgi:MFS family permease